MLPEKSLKQLKELRKKVRNKDINDKVSKDETKLPNLYWMDNPVDGGRIQSWEEYTKKDNKKQTTAFKSKLVNKPLINKDLSEKINNKKMKKAKNLLGFKEFDIKDKIKSNKKVAKDILKEEASWYKIVNEKKSDEVKAADETDHIYGFAGKRDTEIKKVGSFTDYTKLINPEPVKERPILNAGQFVETKKVKGYINRIVGNKVFVESLEEPGKTVEISIKEIFKPLKKKK